MIKCVSNFCTVSKSVNFLSQKEKSALSVATIMAVGLLALSVLADYSHSRSSWKTYCSLSASVFFGIGIYYSIRWRCAVTKKFRSREVKEENNYPKVQIANIKLEKISNQECQLFQIPLEIFYEIFANLPSFESLARLGQVCKKFYVLTHNSQLLTLLFKKFYPTKELDFSENPISVAANFQRQCRSLTERFSPMLELLKSAEELFFIPETSFFNRKEFFHYSAEFCPPLEFIFGKHSIIRGKGNDGNHYLFVRYQRIPAIGQPVQDFFYIEERQFNSYANQWSCLFCGLSPLNVNPWLLESEEKKKIIEWYKNFFAGKLCSIPELRRSIKNSGLYLREDDHNCYQLYKSP